MDWQQIIDTVTVQLTAFGLKAAGAIAVWIVGRYLINLAVRLVTSAMSRQHVDPTILRYLGNIITVTLNIILVIAILGYFGVETTSFAALIAAMGIAIGAAWAGLLANFVDFNERGPLLAVRPYTHTDTNRVIADTFGAAGYPVPESHVRMKQLA